MTVPSTAELATGCQRCGHSAEHHVDGTGICRALNNRRRPCCCKRFLEQLDVKRVYQFLTEYIKAHRYAPTLLEIAAAMKRSRAAPIGEALSTLEGQGKIKRYPWPRGITLTTSPEKVASLQAETCVFSSETRFLPGPTVEQSLDWKRITKVFRGVVIHRLTGSQIARYFRARCLETDRNTAECEANFLLGLRFPEIFLERRAKLEALAAFMDIPKRKRGCRSCRARFHKIRWNQVYCDARCRRREKARRRNATAHGKLLRSQQNKRYRQNHRDQEGKRKREWRLSHGKEYRAQREREATRRMLNRPWGRKRFRQLPPAVANLGRSA